MKRKTFLTVKPTRKTLKPTTKYVPNVNLDFTKLNQEPVSLVKSNSVTNTAIMKRIVRVA